MATILYRHGHLLQYRNVVGVSGRWAHASPVAFNNCAKESADDAHNHIDFLTKMYRAAPISGLLNHHDIVYDRDYNTTIHFTAEERHCHTARSLHGSAYFKLLDDASFFAAQAHVKDVFILTASFNTYFLRPILPGMEVVAKGRTTSVGNSMILAEAEIFTVSDGKLAASGSGTFLKSRISLGDLNF